MLANNSVRRQKFSKKFINKDNVTPEKLKSSILSNKTKSKSKMTKETLKSIVRIKKTPKLLLKTRTKKIKEINDKYAEWGSLKENKLKSLAQTKLKKKQFKNRRSNILASLNNDKNSSKCIKEFNCCESDNINCDLIKNKNLIKEPNHKINPINYLNYLNNKKRMQMKKCQTNTTDIYVSELHKSISKNKLIRSNHNRKKFLNIMGIVTKNVRKQQKPFCGIELEIYILYYFLYKCFYKVYIIKATPNK